MTALNAADAEPAREASAARASVPSAWMRPMSRSCVIVGAGPAGLAAAHRLQRRRRQGDGARGVERDRRAHAHRAGRRLHRQHRRQLPDDVLRLDAGAAEDARPRDRWRRPPQLGSMATPFGKIEMELSAPRRILRFPLISLSGKLRTAAMFANAALRRARPRRPAEAAGLARPRRDDRAVGPAHRRRHRLPVPAAHRRRAVLLHRRRGASRRRSARRCCATRSAGSCWCCRPAWARCATRWRRASRCAPAARPAASSCASARCRCSTPAAWSRPIACIVAAPASAIAKLEGAARPAGPRRRRRACAPCRTWCSTSATSGRSPSSTRWSRPPDRAATRSRACAPGRRCAPPTCPRARSCSPSRRWAGAAPSCSSATRARSSPPCAPTPRRCSAASPIPTGSASTRAPRAPSSPSPATTGAWPPSSSGRARAVLYAGDWLTGSTIEGAVWSGVTAADAVLKRA